MERYQFRRSTRMSPGRSLVRKAATCAGETRPRPPGRVRTLASPIQMETTEEARYLPVSPVRIARATAFSHL